MLRPHLRVITALTLGLLATGTVSSAAQEGWTHYAGDTFQRYSALDQIDAGNFSDLEIAWRWRSVDAMVSRTMPDGSEWWAPLDAIVESLVADTPNLYRPGHLPRAGGMAAILKGLGYRGRKDKGGVTRFRRASKPKPKKQETGRAVGSTGKQQEARKPRRKRVIQDSPFAKLGDLTAAAEK